MKEDFELRLRNLSNEIGITLNDQQVELFYNYMNLLLDWNSKINLTAITEQNDIILKHFIDSMTVFDYLKDVKSIVDVGTGAGFPGIPIGIMCEDKKITLMDSLNKRIKFLDDVIEKNNLNNIVTIHSRAEDLGKNDIYRENFDVAISRAVANLATLVEYMLPLVKVGGKCICMKGQDIKKEIKDSEIAIEILGGEIETIDEFCLPGTEMKRNILVIRKIKKTNNKYPRKAGIPLKEPLK